MSVDAELKRRDENADLQPWTLATDVGSPTGFSEPVVDAGAREQLQAILARLLATLTVAGTVALDASTLAALEQITASGPLTDTQLRATPVAVSGTVALDAPTLAALETINAIVAGTVGINNFPATQPVTGPLTDTQLRATLIPVSGPLTDAELRAAAVPVSLATGSNLVGYAGSDIAAHARAQRCFAVRYSATSLAGGYGCRLTNPAGSGKTAYVYGIEGTADQQFSARVWYEGTIVTALVAVTPTNLYQGGPAPVCTFGGQESSTVTGGGRNIGHRRGAANTAVDLLSRGDLLVIPPGSFVSVDGGAVVTAVNSLVVYWYEV